MIIVIILLTINVVLIDYALCKFVKMFKDFGKMSKTINFDFWNEGD